MPETLPHSGSPTAEHKRRKIRKGTLSCWQCKRRKTRCTFAAPAERVCDGCRSRRTECVSQEFEEDGGVVGRSEVRREAVGEAEDLERSGCGKDGEDSGLPHVGSGHIWLSLEAESLGRLDDISRTLRAAWPSHQDLDLILRIPISLPVLFHGIICKPCAAFFSSDLNPTRMLHLPPPGCHPVLIARRLLTLGTFLQGIPPSSLSTLTGLSADCQGIMSRAVKAARLVTGNDELVVSLEGVECLMMESMYLNNGGNLRRAWLVSRRAMGLAQMMGLHTGNNSPNVLEAETRRRVDPEWMWCRLVFTDRYLSLMLGLPQCSPGDIFAIPEALGKCTPLERMERVMAVAGGLIIERNSSERTDVDATMKIDTMLRDAAALMPPRWWMPPDSTILAMKKAGAEAFDETLRVMNQFTHRHLLVQLHLPYTLLPSTNPQHDYSKTTAANASRDIISLWLTFRSASTAPAYCRGVDFITFIASTTLSLAHIESRRQSAGLRALQHQRLGDRGLLERVLETMEMEMARGDVVARRIAGILRPLLEVEEQVARGLGCESGAVLEEDGVCAGADAGQDEGLRALRIAIPHLGTIKVEHFQSSAIPRPLDSDSISDSVRVNDSHSQSHLETSAQPSHTDWPETRTHRADATQALEPRTWDHAMLSADEQGPPFFFSDGDGDCDGDGELWALQGVDVALFGSWVGGGDAGG